MRAAQVAAPGQVEMVDSPLPRPGAGEVRVRLQGCGVCASNLEPFAGQPWSRFPMEPGVLGHEGWGIVDALGEGVAGLARGDRVASLGQHAYATHDVVPAALTVRLPEVLADRPVPAEPIACALMILTKARIGAGDTVAVVGTGFIGLLLTRLAAQAGARVIALARRPEALELARTLGADEAVAMNGSEADAIGRLSGGRMVDVAVECTGHQAPLDLAAHLCREGGRLVIAGFHQGQRQVDMLGWNWRALEIVNAHERDMARMAEMMRQGVALLAEGQLDLGPLLTHSYPLDRVGEALEATRDKPRGFVKAWVQC